MTEFYKFYVDNPDEPKAVIRVDAGQIDRYAPDSQSWVSFPAGIAYTGIGGENGYMRVEEDEAFAIMESLVERGGPGSGNWGHKGRPGKRGGSAPRHDGEPGRPVNPRFPNLQSSAQRAKRRKVLDQFYANFSEKKAKTALVLDKNMNLIAGQQPPERLAGATIMSNNPSPKSLLSPEDALFMLDPTIAAQEIINVASERISGLQVNAPLPKARLESLRKRIRKELMDVGSEKKHDLGYLLDKWREIGKDYDEIKFWWEVPLFSSYVGQSSVERGGPGSGNHGHGGLKGVHGGSSPGGGGKKSPSTRVGITSARPDSEDEKVFADMRDFEKALNNIPTVTNITVEPGRGGWEGGSEPTWVVAYDGNGKAQRLLAQTGKNFNQDAVIIYEADDSPDASPLTDFQFNETVTDAQRDAIEKTLVDNGIGGWTWFQQDGDKTVLRMLYVPPWAENSAKQHLGSLDRILVMLDAAGYDLSREDAGVKVTIMENNDGESGYSQFLQ